MTSAFCRQLRAGSGISLYERKLVTSVGVEWEKGRRKNKFSTLDIQKLEVADGRVTFLSLEIKRLLVG